MERRRWTENELVKVLALYCQLPFGKMHARNPAVTALAEKVGRSPSAVALKLVNFASLDPDLGNRGVAGMSNVSASDRRIWDQYYGRWEALADAAAVDAAGQLGAEVDHQSEVAVPTPAGPTEVERVARTRRGQSFFRATVVAAYEWRCCITGIGSLELLRASHIVPWSQDSSVRLDPRNGVCLNALHDAAFDRGLITFGDRFELRVSRKLKREVPESVFNEMFERHAGRPIRMPERFSPDIAMLRRHRACIFQHE